MLHGYILLTSNVFPTHVGVFLAAWLHIINKQCFPHARRGVSRLYDLIVSVFKFSPRTWGCFFRYTLSNILGGIFSI